MIFKYKELTIKIKCMLNVETTVIPVKTGTTGTISKSHRKSPSNLPGKHIKKLD
jgi:hypothetical protein